MGMKKLRRYFSPLSSDSAAPLNLPPVRVGLLTKLNLLTVGLIVLAALATSGFYFARLWYYEDDDLRARGDPRPRRTRGARNRTPRSPAPSAR